MAIDPHYISLQDAAILTARWRHNLPPGAFNGGQFARIAFDNLLNQPGCAGIRIYMGMELPGAKDNPSLWTFVLVGTDANGNDMVGATGAMTTRGSSADDGGGTEEYPVICPPNCGDPSPLNSPP
jgi:hypothetical protein